MSTKNTSSRGISVGEEGGRGETGEGGGGEEGGGRREEQKGVRRRG